MSTLCRHILTIWHFFSRLEGSKSLPLCECFGCGTAYFRKLEIETMGETKSAAALHSKAISVHGSPCKVSVEKARESLKQALHNWSSHFKKHLSGSEYWGEVPHPKISVQRAQRAASLICDHTSAFDKLQSSYVAIGQWEVSAMCTGLFERKTLS